MDLCSLKPETGVRIVPTNTILTPVLIPGETDAL
jgi:hypothetical protein